MDAKRKKELISEYKNRKTDRGVFSLRCLETGESFLGWSQDVQTELTSLRFKLSTGSHPNKRLLELWKARGEAGFDISVLELIKYEDPTEDHAKELETLRGLYLEADSKAAKIWR